MFVAIGYTVPMATDQEAQTMTTTTTSTGEILRIERLVNSTNGNPRYKIRWTDGDDVREAITQSDASYGYEIGNPGHRVGDVVTFTLTKAGRISYGVSA